MSEIKSALVWHGDKEGESPLTVTLQEVKVQKKGLLLALLCEGEEGGKSPQVPAGYFCESMVGWFYNQLLPWCKRKPECTVTELEKKLRSQWERSLKELRDYGKMRAEEGAICVSGIVFYGSCFVAFGNRGVYVLNRRFLRPRKKNILPKEGGLSVQTGEVRSFLSFYLESEGMEKVMPEVRVLESLYTEYFFEEQELGRRLTELGKAAAAKVQGGSVGAIILEVEP